MLKFIQRFGVGRLAAMVGIGAGAAALLIAMLLRMGAQPQSLLYSNLDLKEASQITAALDQAAIKYDVKGDGSTIMVARDEVASTRLMLSAKGLPTSGSVGYEIFDDAPALGQTDFVQNLNRQRALEGELARTIGSIRGVTSARVHLVIPKRQLFEDEAATPSASIMIAAAGRGVTPEQVRAIRNLVAGAVPDLKPERVTLIDEAGELLAGGEEGGDDGLAAAATASKRAEIEERIRKTVKELVEGVVGAGKARVQVSADLDLSRVTLQEEKFDPDGQVVRSTQTTSENSNETRPGATGVASVSANIPGGPGPAPTTNNSTSGRTEETTNYEISRTTRTEVQEPGKIKRLSVAVAVDGVTAAGKDGKPGAYTPRTAQEMQRIEELVRSAVGFDQERGDQVTVANVRFERPGADAEGVSSKPPLLDFDKNDILRGVELAVMLVVAVLLVLFVVRPMLKPPAQSHLALALAGGHGGSVAGGGGGEGMAAVEGQSSLALPSPGELDHKIDIAKIEGQVKASSVRKVAEFVENHPEESVSILRSWLHDA